MGKLVYVNNNILQPQGLVTAWSGIQLGLHIGVDNVRFYISSVPKTPAKGDGGLVNSTDGLWSRYLGTDSFTKGRCFRVPKTSK